jgi:VWFA-related protein
LTVRRVGAVTGTAVLAIGLLSSPYIIGESPFAVAAGQTPDVPRFRVAVDAVRVDAVVTDRDGRIVTDLTADDFEVRQDGKRQAVTFAQFVPVLSGPAPEPETAGAGTGSRAEPARPRPPVRRTDVQRTLAIVVDDLGFSFESLQNTQRALHAFVDRELRPTDLVALVRTGGTGGGLQPFTTDRRVLHAAIDALRWNWASRSGVEAFEPLNVYALTDEHSDMADLTDFTSVNLLRSSMSAVGTLGALNLVVRGARDLPGRKAVLFVSEGFVLKGLEPDSRVRIALDRVIDEATRAGVVIYALDCRGLQTAGLQAADNLKVGGLAPGQMDEKVRSMAADRVAFNRNTQEGMAYLAEQTGGFAVLNNNDLARGLARITNDVRGYYVIGYVPREGTFARPGQKASSHKIAIDVKRPGLRVKTRKAFLGVSDPPETPASETPAQQLVHAATSPFAATDIALGVTTLPGYAPGEGMFVRTLLHIDAHALTFVDGEGGKQTAVADVLGMVFDQEGTEVAHLSTGFAVALTKDAADEALREGLVYTLRIPIRRPGAYQARFAVRDQHSGVLGSAGEFVDVGDMAGGAFTLSGIVLRSEDGTGASGSSAADSIALTAAQAVRVYRPGTRLSYAYEIYNATTTVQATTSIWRGTEQVFAAAPDRLAVPPGGDRRFAAAGGLKLGEGLPPGSYVLQVSAMTPDPKRRGRSRLAVQRMDFDVR